MSAPLDPDVRDDAWWQVVEALLAQSGIAPRMAAVGAGAGLLCDVLTRLGVHVVGVPADPETRMAGPRDNVAAMLSDVRSLAPGSVDAALWWLADGRAGRAVTLEALRVALRPAGTATIAVRCAQTLTGHWAAALFDGWAAACEQVGVREGRLVDELDAAELQCTRVARLRLRGELARDQAQRWQAARRDPLLRALDDSDYRVGLAAARRLPARLDDHATLLLTTAEQPAAAVCDEKSGTPENRRVLSGS